MIENIGNRKVADIFLYKSSAIILHCSVLLFTFVL